MWFYQDGQQQRGPVSQEELVRALLAGQDPRRILVWREGMASWQEAGSVPEIRDGLPPSVSSTVPIADNAETIAKLYRRLVFLVGLQILLGFFQLPAQANSSRAASPLGCVVGLVALAVLGATAVTAYKLAGHLEAGAPLAWAIAMFLPCINILVLLVLSSKAQSWCQRYGIKVGLLGPTKQSIEELRRRILTAPFD
jgi:hypothetical protein